MYIRCGGCWASTSVRGDAGAVTCSSCGVNYSLAAKAELGSTPDERSRRAQALAAEHQIDLATAYSVLLGIMPLEAATLMSGLEFSPESRGVPYDPGFRDAIESGHLTLQQAVERGDRVAYASKIAQRHGLDMDVAFQVADNHITVAAALKATDAPAMKADATPAPTAPPVPRRSHAAIYAIVLAGLCMWAYLSAGWVREREDSTPVVTPALRSNPAKAKIETSRATIPEPSERPASSGVVILVDKTGALTQVTGPDPKSVLEAFCLHPRNRSRLSPRSIVPSAVRSSGDQVGLIEDHEHGSAITAVVISRDPRSRKWRIGNGQSPIGFLDSVPVARPAITSREAS